MAASLMFSRIRALEEDEMAKRPLCLDDLRGFKLEEMSKMEGFLYLAKVMHEKLRRRKEIAAASAVSAPASSTATTSIARSTPHGVPANPLRRHRSLRRRSNCGTRRFPSIWEIWNKAQESAPPVKETEESAEEYEAAVEEDGSPRDPGQSRRSPKRMRRSRKTGEDASRATNTNRQRRNTKPRRSASRNRADAFNPTELPPEVREWIENGLEGTDLQPVCQKMMTKTDLNRHHMRLLIPMDCVVSTRFLSEEERETVSVPSKKGDERGIAVRIISRGSQQEPRELSLRMWAMQKRSGNETRMYVLTKRGWGEVIEDHNLHEGQVIQLWSYRISGQLHLLVVTLPAVEATEAEPEPEQESQPQTQEEEDN